MSVAAHYTAPLLYQNLALYHPISRQCLTPQVRTDAQAKRRWNGLPVLIRLLWADPIWYKEKAHIPGWILLYME